MRVRIVVAIVSILALTAFAPAPFVKPKPQAPKGGLEAMQGDWEVVSLKRGSGTTTKYPGKMTARIEGTKWSFRLVADGKFAKGGGGGPRGAMDYTIVVGAAGKTNTLDLKRAGQDTPHVQGIYKIEGDQLLFTYLPSIRPGLGKGMPARAERPTAFEPMKAEQLLMTLKRLNDPKKGMPK